MKKAAVIVCATRRDLELTGRVRDAHVPAVCRRCGAELLMSPTSEARARAENASEIIILCQPCAREAAAFVKAAGKPTEVIVTDAAQQSIDSSPAARERFEEIMRLLGKE